MVAKKKEKGTKKKLKLKKETMRDLDAKGSGRHVKAGFVPTAAACGPTNSCVSCNMWC